MSTSTSPALDEPNSQPISAPAQTRTADLKVPRGYSSKPPPAGKPKRRGMKAFTDLTPEELEEFRKESEELLAELEAQAKAEEALSPKEKRQRSIDFQRNALQRHLLPRYAYGRTGDPAFLEHFPVIIIQMAPWSPRGASCKSDICGRKIEVGDYRIALSPGMASNNYHKSPGKMQSICLRNTKSPLRIFPRPMLREFGIAMLPRNPSASENRYSQLLESRKRPRYRSWEAGVRMDESSP